jgi:hypothetical protein
MRRLAPLVVLALLLATAASAAAANRFVGVGGGDVANNCLLAATPCATIQHAVDEAGAGDTVAVAAGSYPEAQIVVDKPLTLEGAGPGQTIVDGSGATGQANTGFLRVDHPAVGDIVVEGFTFEGANGNNAGGEALTMLFEGVPASSHVTIAENELLSSEALDPKLGEDWSLGLFISNSPAQFEVVDNVFEGMWQGVLAERSTGAKIFAGNEFAKLVPNDDGTHVWPAEGILLLAIGQNGGAGETVGEQLVVENSFHDYAGLGIAVQSGHASATPTTPNSFDQVLIGGNQIELGGAIFPTTGRPLGGVVLKTGQVGSTILNPVVAGNTIAVGAPGDDVAIEGGVSGAEVIVNRLGGDPAAGVGSTAVDPVLAAPNWWGCNAGANEPGCTAASGAIATSPNLILTADASRSQLQPGQQATITASLREDSDGGIVDGSFPFPDAGPPIGFNAASGSFVPGSAGLEEGAATSTFTAGSQLGGAGVTVSLDGERVAVPLTVVAPPASTSPASQPAAVTPSVQPVASVRAAGTKAPVSVPGSGQVKVAVVSCAAGTCSISVRAPEAKIGGRSYKVRVEAPRKVTAGGSATVKVVLPKAAREALAANGKGRVTLKLTVTSSTGATETISVTVKLKAGKGGGKHS